LALSCLRHAAELGQPQAQSNLGVKLIKQGPLDAECDVQIAAGDGYTPSADVLEGLDWLRKAAAQQDVGACFNLATILSRDKEIAPLWSEAAGAYRIAAETGHYPSQIRLGFCYRNGFGVPKDRVQAFMWTALAARHGVGTALEQLEKIVFEMSARERADGEDLLRARADPNAQTRGAVPFLVVTS
jgi:TPR repeat protein